MKAHPFKSPEEVRDMLEMDEDPWADVPDEFWEPKPGEVWTVWGETCRYIMKLPEPYSFHLVYNMLEGELALFPRWPKGAYIHADAQVYDVSDWRNLNFFPLKSLDPAAGLVIGCQ